MYFLFRAFQSKFLTNKGLIFFYIWLLVGLPFHFLVGFIFEDFGSLTISINFIEQDPFLLTEQDYSPIVVEDTTEKEDLKPEKALENDPMLVNVALAAFFVFVIIFTELNLR